ncbi:unnamed protein product [Prorocentrum cordatum]|uniref:Uncharacterized protein n=1 Tax=Prorocentrum cordatum TaxID=2364126 RepID=A0ABN9RSA0_9DINO|nr:unnamed protein product [Polarella glacialis]
MASTPLLPFLESGVDSYAKRDQTWLRPVNEVLKANGVECVEDLVKLGVRAATFELNGLPEGKVAFLERDSAARRELASAYSAVRAVQLSPAPVGGPRISIACGDRGVPPPAAIQASLARARAVAIAGSAPRSFGSWRAAVRAWMAFARRRLNGDGCSALPPSADEVCLFALEFRSPRTFGNYVAQLKKACQLLGRDASVFTHPLVRGARKAIGKRHSVRRPPKHFVLLSHLPRMLDFVSTDSALRALFLVSWGFALRAPSAALLIGRGDPLAFKDFAFSDLDLRRPRARVLIFFSGDSATLHFSRRKHRDGPTVAVRKCWCAHSQATCIVHAAQAFFESICVGSPAFPHLRRVDSNAAVSIVAPVQRAMKAAALHAGAPSAASFTSKAFRRGRAETKRRCNGCLCEILRGAD